ncbi:MAG: energy transducer TonB, partial [Fluviicola sp.]
EILENGKVENFKILKNTTNSELLGQEAINVIELTKFWKPAFVNGLPVKSSYVLPISFDIKKI